MKNERPKGRYELTDEETLIGTRTAAIREAASGRILSFADEEDMRQLVAVATAWLDAPRLAARATAEVVAQEIVYGVRFCLLRTPHKWGVGDDSDPVVEWYTGPDAERLARTDYAESRGKALCICGAECDADEIDRSGDEPQCPKCVAEAVAAFKAQPMRCAQYDCNGSPCTGHKPCGWTGTGADLSAPSADFEPYECPKCGAFSVEEIAP